ncbi:alpha/beta hydrolase [candidate division KSB3 bacterium]|uniref:Alpha/beta hydrolase n=1 Tax=candidate division KSB3 bacterium TaxID=2044937 RepID=A0A2G6K9Q0_9BACT|nr:MAG: alpha/beta hydrolase [candidate division KSB3 bacterium]
MPLLQHSDYTPPFIFRNPHLHTIYPSIFRKVNGVSFTRERIDTPDGDFLDLDWSRIGAKKLILAIHGLEGSSHSGYIPGIIHAFQRRGWDGVALNLRSCSGEPNRLLRSYHSGATEDVETTIAYLLRHYHYTKIAIVGFSLGGNLTLKYLGERGASLPPEIFRAAAISTPCDLKSSAWQISEELGGLYLKNFLWHFRRKIRQKMKRMPGAISDENFHEIKTLRDYDERYTAPIHGFASAEDYWTRCSSKQFLPDICIPTFLLNAQDDPFLRQESFPFEEAQSSSYLFFEAPKFGGHVGFVARNLQQEYWHETRVVTFIHAEVENS